ncbi:TetR/AcrR family transcriptional regulator [Phenylobacterium sp.]|uniref:TetR/AcrR family transcriptional regulator n=1 Tax=Phenylobacterium sp. TaxID=1871053 RepID=UPI0026200D00|nr:TetR/AcrR family transcriptional regulator [Phenylobacterium sp.]
MVYSVRVVKSPVSSKRQRTREALIDATLAVIAEKGFEGASLDEIAARAGVTKGAIYSNFRSKAELVWEAAGRRRLSLQPPFRPGVPLRDQHVVAETLLAQFAPAQRFAEFNGELQLYIRRDPELKARQAALYKQIFDAGEAQLEALFGHELEIPARSLVLAAQAMALGFIAQFDRTPDEVTPQVVEAAFDSLAIGATSPRKGAKKKPRRTREP